MTVDSSVTAVDPNPDLPPDLGLFTILRLGLFNLGLGLMSVLTVAVLNRVMISELGIPGWVTAGAIALPYLVSPARVWFGQLSDSRPLWGLHRTGYVRVGVVVMGLMVWLAVQVVWQLGGAVAAAGQWSWQNPAIAGWAIVLSLVFLCYGLAVSACSIPFTALLVDVSDERKRSKLVAIVWSKLMVGIVIGGIGGAIWGKIFIPEDLGDPLTTLYGPITALFTAVPLLFFCLALIATWGIERTYSHFQRRSEGKGREDSVTLKDTLRLLTSNRQTGIFFSFLLILTIGLFLQEAVLEPYGGEVFGMAIGETTALNSFWGIGILLGYSATGFFLIPRFGKKRVTKWGCALVAVCFILIILSGFTQNAEVLKGAMILFGIAAGMTTIGSINLMLDLTTAETAGTFVGAWGLSQAIARGLAIFSGGVILDVSRSLFQIPLLAYGAVFLLQSISMVIAIALLARVDVAEFRANTRTVLATAMEADLD
ncbi:BCD family MFS transporter [Spirulina major CS-329]|uniref:BCD family MFS transporter n=1 Tax=Spirulina TaxID=1154 RepID=UPI00232F23DF|nr:MULTISPECIES: BCD family MFS transporter [Spirulina]MDB9494578.1 BCD family MFS transporter [Spirulina subsalsa CS-330]MDB9504827.1 BCD family MFS transporter [Spirulina major CS-329]